MLAPRQATAAQGDRLDAALRGARLIAQVDHPQAGEAAALADALLEGGVRVAELSPLSPTTLRTASTIARVRPALAIGIGGVTSADALRRACDAGARFATSPGLTTALGEALALVADACPLLPGVATASAVMAARAAGFRRLSASSVMPVCGPAGLRALGGPLPDVRFCPAGAIDRVAAARYLDLPNVFCVATTRIAAPASEQDWSGVRRTARAFASGTGEAAPDPGALAALRIAPGTED